MRKTALLLTAIFALFSNGVFADAKIELQQRLSKVTAFTASFSQVTSNEKGDVIQEGEGELWLQRPNLFNWHMIEPDESELISDGKSLWFFNPFVEQVTITDLDSAADNTPFMLIARNEKKDWENYQVTQQGDLFILKPKMKSELVQFEVTVGSNGIIQSFVAIENYGQKNSYHFSGQKAGKVNANKFHFKAPKGVTIDDQRQ